MSVDFRKIRDQVIEMTPEERRLWAKAIATEESKAAKGTPFEYAWNRVWRQVDRIDRGDPE